MDRYRFTTTLTWQDGEDEIETRARVLYTATRGYADTLEEPGSSDEIEIVSLAPIGSEVRIPDHFYTDDDLLAECAEDWAGELEEAREWRAQARRDDLLMEKF